MAEDSSDGARINISKLKGLVRRIDSKKALADLARSDLGNLYQEAEDYGFNRAALKMALKLRNMEDDKRNDFLSALAAYCDELGVWDQGDLFDHQPKTPKPRREEPVEPGYRLGQLVSERRGQHSEAAPLSAEPDAPKRRGRPRKTEELVQ
ncbi:MAG: DUF2312 domain-containing protein [Candidatus Binataceae bacterium]|nr:DUF2312 domain-containing protein [Candidatus Binataceae bacterium]